MKIIAVLLVLALGACARSPWTRAGSTQADADTELLQCRYDAEKATATVDLAFRSSLEGSFERGSRRAELIIACMRARGWQ